MSTVARMPHLRAGLLVSALSLAVIAFATLTPEPPVVVRAHFCFLCGTYGGVNSVLNVALFVPLGVGLALCGVPAKRAILGMCALSLLIETAQLLVIPGRYATIGDVITNSVGGAFGYAITISANAWIRPTARTAKLLAAAATIIWLSMQLISIVGFVESLPTSRYYGQIAPRLKRFTRFRGQVLSANIGGLRVPNTAFADSSLVQALLRDGAVVSAKVLPVRGAPGMAPILRVADDAGREIVLLAEDGGDVVFAVRTAASLMRLRPPIFAIRNSGIANREFGSSADTLFMAASYKRDKVSLAWQTESESRQSQIHPTGSLGWTFWLPFLWTIEGTRTELLLGAIWILGLSIPLGYWWAASAHSNADRAVTKRWLPVAIAIPLVLFTGFVLIPRTLGLSPGSFRDWLAAAFGLLVGALLQYRTRRSMSRPAHA